ncbi:hypothetical protein [Brevibacillus borstelensis]|uniref:hypothetical protein n=1 Tax=Brevibacillus borstelensis TaxID=45462 RepID=UPI0030BEEDC9
MQNRSLGFYLIAAVILLVFAVSTLFKTFIDIHPLRYLFVAILLIGAIVGYFRYFMKMKRKEMEQKSKLLRYGVLLLFILAYMAIRYGVQTFVSYEVSSQDYGVVMAFFILGLFISYYGLYALYLWRQKQR